MIANTMNIVHILSLANTKCNVGDVSINGGASSYFIK